MEFDCPSGLLNNWKVTISADGTPEKAAKIFYGVSGSSLKAPAGYSPVAELLPALYTRLWFIRQPLVISGSTGLKLATFKVISNSSWAWDI